MDDDEKAAGKWVQAALPRSQAVLADLLKRTGDVIDYLTAARQTQKHYLASLEKLIKERASLDPMHNLMVKVEAEALQRAAAGPSPLPVQDHLNRDAFEVARKRFDHAAENLSRAQRDRTNPGYPERCVAAIRGVVWALAAMTEVFDELRKRVVAALDSSADSADTKPDSREKKPVSLPQNGDILELARLINKSAGKEGSQRAVALQFTEGNLRKAASLLRQLRRYPDLVNRSRKSSS
jgi:hypothetical protein